MVQQEWPDVILTKTESIICAYFLGDPNITIGQVRDAAILQEETIRITTIMTNYDFPLARQSRSERLKALGIDPETLEVLPPTP